MKARVYESLGEIESLVRSGRHEEARARLKAIPASTVPRELLADFAALLRRTGSISRALKALNPIVRDPSGLTKASDRERVEYALSLVRAGANDEASRIFSAIAPDKEPDVLLYSTFALTPEWRYPETIAPLERYIGLASTGAYQKLVALVNLAAALIFCEKHAEAERVLLLAMRGAEEQGSLFLLGSLHELRAQIAIAEKEFDRAEEHLEKGGRLLGTAATIESFYVEKWRSLLGFLKDPSKNADRLAQLRAKAFAIGDWETARDCDYQALKASADSQTFEYLYAGSPTLAYRDWLSSKFPANPRPAAMYMWRLDGERAPDRTMRFLDASTGETQSGRRILEAGDAPQRLLILLARDFYRPQSLGSVASRLFPEEFYHPVHTPMKLHQILARLRESLSAARLPVRVESDGGFMKLTGRARFSILKDWTLDTVKLDPTFLRLRPLVARFGHEAFTAKEAAVALDVSLSTSSRLLEKACEEGIGSRLGGGKSTRYRLPQKETTPENRLRPAG